MAEMMMTEQLDAKSDAENWHFICQYISPGRVLRRLFGYICGLSCTTQRKLLYEWASFSKHQNLIILGSAMA